MVPPVSDGASPTPPYSGYHYRHFPFAHGALTRSGPPSQTVTLKSVNQISWSYNPSSAVTEKVWAPARSLATTCAIIVIFSSYGYLDVSVPRVRSLIKSGYWTFSPVGCPIRKPVDHPVCAGPHSLSQLIASFIASGSLGIPPAPFLNCLVHVPAEAST